MIRMKKVISGIKDGFKKIASSKIVKKLKEIFSKKNFSLLGSKIKKIFKKISSSRIVNKIRSFFNKMFLSKSVKSFKESKKFKFVGLTIIVIILIMTIIGVSIDIAPSNSVTVYVTDQYGDGITGLEIVINSDDDSSFERVIKYTKGMKKNRAIELVPGEYMLNFKNIPTGYTCFTVNDTFSMIKDEKKKLKYECIKSK